MTSLPLSDAGTVGNRPRELPSLLKGVLDATVALTEADSGAVQLVDAAGDLKIVAQHGLPDWWGEYWDATGGAHGVCGTALSLGQRVLVGDVERSPLLAASPALDVQRRAGIRAEQSTPVRGQSGQVVGMLSTHYRKPKLPDAKALMQIDLATEHAAALIERAQAEQALARLDARYRAVIESSADGFWMVDAATRIIAVNGVYAERSGYSREELLGMRVSDLDAQETEEGAKRHHEAIRDQGFDLFETTHRTKSGEDWPVEVNVSYRPEAGGSAFAFLRDISQRKRLEAEVRATEERFRLAMEAVEEGVWDWNLQSGAIYCSPSCAAMLGYAPGELRSHISSWVGLLHPDETKKVQVETRRLLLEAGHYAVEYRLRRKDGNYCWVLSRGKVIERSADGQALRAIGTHMDITSAKRLELARRESEERLRLFIEHAPAALAMFDREMRYLLASRRWRDDHCLGATAIIGRCHYELFPEVGEERKAMYRRALAGETVSADRDRFIRPDGSVRWLRWDAMPWYAASGRVGGIVVFAEDITARLAAEDALRESESQLSRAQEAARVGTWEWDVLSDRNHWSDETFRLYGLEPGAVVPSYDTWLAVLRVDDRAAVVNEIHARVAQGEGFEVEWRPALVGGEERWLLSRGQPQFDGARHVRRYLGIVMDVTERKQALQALERTRNMLAEAQKFAHMGSFEYFVSDGTTVWSEEQFRLHGLDPGGPSPNLDALLAHHLPPEDAEEWRRGFIAAVGNHEMYEQEYRLVWPDGSRHWVHTVARPLFDEQGTVARYAGTTVDITERRRQEEGVQKHSEVLQALARKQVAVQTAAAFAHELNQPLVAVSAYSEVALGALREGKSERLERAVKGSHEQALRAGRVLHELLDHLQKGEPAPAPFDLNVLITTVIAKIRKEGQDGFHTALELEAGLPRVLGNRLQTEKVLRNLIENGIEAMREAGLSPALFIICVRTLASRKMAHVTVRDRGPGLSAEIAKRIFDPFFSTKPNGLGLGLAISRSLIEAQGGQLWLDPEDGPGAVFHFTLPFGHD